MLGIGKIRGVILSAVIIAIYYLWWLPYWHYQWFGFEAERGWSTALVLAGLIMTQVVVIQPGDRAKLTFLGAELDREWKSGIALLPNAFHTTIVLFEFSILWGLAVLKNNTFERYREPDVEIKSSDSNLKYQVNIQMSYTQAQLSRLSEFIMKLFFDYKRLPREYYVCSFGYRVLGVGIILVCFNSAFVSTKHRVQQFAQTTAQAVVPKQEPPPVPQAPQPSIPRTQERKEYTLTPLPEEARLTLFPRFDHTASGAVPFSHNGIKYNLVERQVPTYLPNKNWLLEERFILLGTMPDGVKYFSSGKNNYNNVSPYQDTICFIIHPEVKTFVNSQRPPKFVVNMHEEVVIGYIPIEPKNRVRDEDDTEHFYWTDKGGWKYLHDGWAIHKRIPNFPGQVIYRVTGPSRDERLNDELNVGLVCF